jgi:hypothetical protein
LFERLEFIVNNDFLERQYGSKNITDDLLEIVNILLRVSYASKVARHVNHCVLLTILVAEKDINKAKKSFQIFEYKAKIIE